MGFFHWNICWVPELQKSEYPQACLLGLQPLQTQPAQAVWQLKAGFVISVMQQLLPRWQDTTLAHTHRIFLVMLVKGSWEGA